MVKIQALGKQGSVECAEFKVAVKLTFPCCDKLYEVCMASQYNLNEEVLQVLNLVTILEVSFMTYILLDAAVLYGGVNIGSRGIPSRF